MGEVPQNCIWLSGISLTLYLCKWEQKVADTRGNLLWLRVKHKFNSIHTWEKYFWPRRKRAHTRFAGPLWIVEPGKKNQQPTLFIICLKWHSSFKHRKLTSTLDSAFFNYFIINLQQLRLNQRSCYSHEGIN